MLVLARKADETILIGDNIKITLLRVRGNSVRIGIEAPREVRVIRGELETSDGDSADEIEVKLSDREQAFAPPSTKAIRPRVNLTENRVGTQSLASGMAVESNPQAPPRIFVGRVRCVDNEAKLVRAPLAGFVSAS